MSEATLFGARAPRDLRELRNALSVAQIAIAAIAVALGAGGSRWALAIATVASVFAFVRPLPAEPDPRTQRAWTLIIFVALAASTARAPERPQVAPKRCSRWATSRSSATRKLARS